VRLLALKSLSIAISAMAQLGVGGFTEAAELRPRTVAAFERYAAATEQRIAAEVETGPFLRLDGLAAAERALVLETLKRGELHIDRLTTREHGEEIDIPDGMVHHWVGVAFVPGATVDEAVALLQDYDRAAEVYAPSIARSKLRARDGNRFQAYLRFAMTKVITVVMDTEHDARFFRPSADRAYSRIVSTKINEVENPGTPRETLKPVGQDGGYLWRLNTYWRFLERDGGVYVQCESISLTRGIPPGLGWLIGGFVTSIPRESLTFTMEKTREELARH